MPPPSAPASPAAAAAAAAASDSASASGAAPGSTPGERPTVDLAIPFDNAYARLPERLFARVAPTPVRQPSPLAFNLRLADELGLSSDRLTSDDGIGALAGSFAAQGSEPLAMAYAGHQFGNWVPQLGDGRAILLGEVIDTRGQRHELQLKGAGKTPWSRGGDGRAGIGPVVREYVTSEAMHALGVPTTRALAAVATGEPVLRGQPSPGAVLTRVARSHVRVGSFQFFAARRDDDALRRMLEHVIEHHYPSLRDAERPALALLDAVLERQADLVARWMSLGFIHGVMNTDNCSVLGDTIDYGPCAFMDGFAADRVFSSIDVQGRYAWGNQPAMAHWNVAQLAQCLLPLIDPAVEAVALPLAQTSVNRFDTLFLDRWAARLGAKIGLPDSVPADVRLDLGRRFLSQLEARGADFTQGFRALRSHELATNTLVADRTFDSWWAERDDALSTHGVSTAKCAECMAAANPVRIPRNHRVEQAIDAAQQGDLSSMRALQAALAEPFTENAALEAYEQAPTAGAWQGRTFCGT